MLQYKTLGIIFANMHDSTVSEMTSNRSMAALPFFGRYRMVDFYLSSMVDADITTVGIVTKSNYQSLMDHIGNARDWDLARRKGVSILPPYSFSNADNSSAYHGRIAALKGIEDYIEHQDCEYIVLSDTDHVCHPDFISIVDKHVASGADVSVVCRTPDTDEESINNSICVKADENGRVTEMLLNKTEDGFMQSMNIFIVAKQLLISMIDEASARMKSMLEKDVLATNLDTIKVNCIPYEGYVRRITSLRKYMEINLELINPENMDALMDGRKIRTKVHDFPPVRYGTECCVKGCCVADGSIIEGTVENCVIFRGVHIGKGAVVRNCVIGQDTVVSPGSTLENVITDKDVTIGENTPLAGSSTYPLYIKKGSSV